MFTKNIVCTQCFIVYRCFLVLCTLELSFSQFVLHSSDLTMGTFVKHDGYIGSNALSESYDGVKSTIQCVRRYVAQSHTTRDLVKQN